MRGLCVAAGLDSQLAGRGGLNGTVADQELRTVAIGKDADAHAEPRLYSLGGTSRGPLA